MAEAFSIKPPTRRGWTLLGICALVTLIFLGAHLLNFAPLAEAQN
jgi:hypothetical protein